MSNYIRHIQNMASQRFVIQCCQFTNERQFIWYFYIATVTEVTNSLLSYFLGCIACMQCSDAAYCYRCRT